MLMNKLLIMDDCNSVQFFIDTNLYTNIDEFAISIKTCD